MVRLASALLTTPLVAAVATQLAPEFEAYVKAFDLRFPDSELQMRRGLYETRLAAVNAQNAKDSLWTAGVNHLTASTGEELTANFGYNKHQRNLRWSLPSLQSTSEAALPDELDWRDHKPNVVTAVKSQGGCGSCWAFTAAAVLESHIALATGVLFDLSPQQLNSCTQNPDRCGGSGGCSGATAQLAFNHTIVNGISTQWDYPYFSGITHASEECKNTSSYSRRAAGVSNYVQLLQNDAGALIRAVQHGPVAVSVAAGNWWMYHGGIFDGCSKSSPVLNHAVTLTGYGQVQTVNFGKVHYWLIRNSWSATWGEQGYMRLRRYPYGEPCGVDSKPLDGYSCAAHAPDNITACGECGILSDSAYPTGAFLGPPAKPEDPALGAAKSKAFLQPVYP
eukprot:TRINITY_DN1112_c0_g1_i2.p1 TRINITY_DN1112_c0_g1~~TRINITY_DN1112_c0_g1_i2.p1  ORF type:complete len:412 (+),score=63.48 TRINITY_DN1112_c0_g1_i2:59-1237(+)